MTLARRALGGTTAATLAMLMFGCGDAKPSVEASNAEAKVSGTVMIHGKPMSAGELIFNPSNYQRPEAETRKAAVKEGKYEVTTLVGQNSVTIAGPEITKEPQLAYAPRTIEVQPGDNTLNIELPPPEQAAGEIAKHKKQSPTESIEETPEETTKDSSE